MISASLIRLKLGLTNDEQEQRSTPVAEIKAVVISLFIGQPFLVVAVASSGGNYNNNGR